MPKNYDEQAFEATVEQYMLNVGGYEQGSPEGYDPELALFPDEVVEFVQKTQPAEWEYLVNLQKEDVQETLINDLVRALGSKHEGCLKVLRHGFKCYGKTFRVAYFKPESGLNPDTVTLYEANRLRIVRQLHFSPVHTQKSVDVTLTLNGLPLVTIELKNPATGQNWRNAVHQYKGDRDPNEPIFQFKKRTLVHFAVDPDEAYMTTRLSGKATYFLPFNQGDNKGAGNPINPDGYKTSYLWERILVRDSFMDILARFMHLEIKEVKRDGKKIRKETMIFPRFHQLDCVRQMVAHAKEHGTGVNYLIQHSAGSGKSHSISWLAHRLASLHDVKDQKVFHSVIVITDRVVLDKQLQDNIYQFEHRSGVVQKIDKHSDQLSEALKSGVPIIITTLQKFPFVTEKVGELPKQRYAVIIDEAHSSQGGEAATELKGVLGGAAMREEIQQKAEEESLPDHEEEVLRTMAKRGKQPNISFFAFTATPKYKTLEVFGLPGDDGDPKPFHLYSMRQAIEEGFIFDVLQNYTTYKTYYRLIKSIEDDPSVDKRKAAQALARFMSLHPFNISQKTEVMVEHFRHFTRHLISGKAKAMVVTSSRLHAVRYKESFDSYIAEKGYNDIKTLVAFSGTVIDPDVKEKEYTETGMNRDADGKSIKERELPEKFDTDDYQVLLVAEKYQTGFDQPLLHTMYVDKRLAGIQAVQTLSRLNRKTPGKEDTFVLDFVNEPEDIQKAFQPFYERTLIGDKATPQHLYEIQAKLEEVQVWYPQEVEEFSRAFYKPKAKQTVTDHEQIDKCINPAVERFKAIDDEKEQEEFRKTLAAFRNLYSFLAQIIPFQDSDLEKLYSYIRFLMAKLPPRKTGPVYDFENEVALKYYRLQKISEGSINLEAGKTEPISGPTAVGTGANQGKEIELSRLIDILNDRFGTEFTRADQLFFDAIIEDAKADESLRRAAHANTKENFSYVFFKALQGLFLDRIDQNEELTAKFMNEDAFRNVISKYLLDAVYQQVRNDSA